MADRRTVLLDAAVEVIAEQGLGGLTHDAVDARAGIAAGSTAELFPPGRALLEGVTQRLIERETEMATGPHAQVEATPEGLASALGAFAHRALGEDRAVTLARYVLQAEAARTPSLRAFYAAGADEVDSWALDLVRRAGSHHAERDVEIMANYVTGLVFHELALPTPDLDAASRVRTLIDALGWRAA